MLLQSCFFVPVVDATFLQNRALGYNRDAATAAAGMLGTMRNLLELYYVGALNSSGRMNATANNQYCSQR